MRFIYNSLLHLSWLFIKIAALFNDKLKLFVSGRKNVFQTLNAAIDDDDKVVWMHVASLGEFEQGLPLLEYIKTAHSDHKIVLTFFSPSGFEVKKNTTAADVVVYLPLDTVSNTKRFLNLTNPVLAIFIKYEIWPNYLHALKERKIPTFLVSALFSKNQIYFKWYGGFMTNALKAFQHLFVQDEFSKKLLESKGFTNSSVSGDTRFDRVHEILTRDNTLDFMEAFSNNAFCLVAGSTWPEDETILVDFINSSSLPIKYVIAPHNIKEAHINKLKGSLSKKTICYSELEENSYSSFEVLIVDTIGLLTKIYSYADMAYVGGGFATGLHNTLEPAVFGVPVLIGPNYEGFKEVEDLVVRKGVLPIQNLEQFTELVESFFSDRPTLNKIGAINSNYLNKNTGATDLIMRHIEQIL